MAGHSQFKNIMHRKGAQDAKRAKLFTKLAREITVAAKQGLPEPEKNPRLRSAIAAARKESMPNDNIERAIKKATGGDSADDFVEMRYEGYGPGGVAIIIDALTDNKNRTASEVRSLFNKYGGNLGETNSVSFMFEQVGEIVFKPDVGDADTVLDAAIEAGATDAQSDETGHIVTCDPNDFAAVRDALEAKLGEPEQASLTWRPQSTAPVDEDQAQTIFKLIEALDDSDDVQRVSANYEISDEVLARLTA